MGPFSSNAAFLSQVPLNPGSSRAGLEPGPSWGPAVHDHVDTYFECITACSLDDGECVTRCVETLREST
ncbi:MAG: hypothetical protein NTZ53_03845 [Cyanobacteria bacterium]|nr:hypothetical protein [Cyanobacteriota bacterium]